jgi:hypothetical protein
MRIQKNFSSYVTVIAAPGLGKGLTGPRGRRSPVSLPGVLVNPNMLFKNERKLKFQIKIFIEKLFLVG